MASDGPILNQVNLVARDVAATMNFYRQLGLDVPAEAAGEQEGYFHVALPLPNGVSLEIDNAALAQMYNAGRRSEAGGASAVLGFAVESREAVDRLYAELLAAGGSGVQPPYDAFWGARYAIVADPDGNAVGLMSPIEPGRRTWPPVESPSL